LKPAGAPILRCAGLALVPSRSRIALARPRHRRPRPPCLLGSTIRRF
jgi:hypothetical protein